MTGGGADELLTALAGDAARGEVCVDGASMDHGKLIAYRAGAIASGEAEGIERHLVACAYCRDFLRELAEPVPSALLERLEAIAIPDEARVVPIDEAREVSEGRAARVVPIDEAREVSEGRAARVVPVGEARVREAGEARGRWTWRAVSAAAGAIAAAALLAVVVPRLGPGSGTGTGATTAHYHLVSVHGGERDTRGAPLQADTATSAVFLRGGDLRVKLAPAAGDYGSAPREVRVYVAAEGTGARAVLERRDVEILRGSGGELGLRASTEALLGPAPGEKKLVIALGENASQLADLEGHTLEQARTKHPQVELVIIEAKLR